MRLLLTLAMVGLAATAQAQNVKNPSRAEWTCSADHAVIDGYRLDIMDKTGAVLQTLDMGKPTPDATNTCAGALNVQPVKFDTNYVARIRAYAGAAESDNSTNSNAFDRVPGKPSNVVLK